MENKRGLITPSPNVWCDNGYLKVGNMTSVYVYFTRMLICEPQYYNWFATQCISHGVNCYWELIWHIFLVTLNRGQCSHQTCFYDRFHTFIYCLGTWQFYVVELFLCLIYDNHIYIYICRYTYTLIVYLTHLPLVLHIPINKLAHHWSR